MIGRWAPALLVLLASFLASGAVDSRDPEYRVKALFLYKSARWIDWPKSNLPENAKEIVIGVVGKDPFGDELDLIEKLKPIKERKVRVARFDSVADIKKCQILFLSSSLTKDEVDRVLARSLKDGFVTVSARKGFVDEGGMINLLIIENKLGFEANAAAAKKAKIKISSQLLKLARRVVEKED